MKTIFGWLLLVLISTIPAVSQGFFPLDIGTQWDFGIIDFPPTPGYTYQFSIRVTGDTLMPNGKYYAIVSDNGHFSYLRQEGALVVGYAEAGDVVVHDFTWKDRDTVRRQFTDNDTILTIASVGVSEKFGRMLKSWTLMTRAVRNPGYEPSWMTITDSLGYTYFGSSPGVYYYCMGIRTKDRTYGVVTQIIDEGASAPNAFGLQQNYPNPFNPSTTISFSIPAKAHVSLKIFDVIGREVATLVSETLSAGKHQKQWNASGMPSGVYFYRLQAGSYTETKRLFLLK